MTEQALAELARTRERREALHSIWQAVAVRGALNTAAMMEVFCALMSFVMLMLCVIPGLGQPFPPLIGVMPSYGAVYAIPHVAIALVNLGGLSVQSIPAQVLILMVNVAAVVLDVFALGVLAAWIYYYYAGTLSVENSNHQSVTMSLFDILLTAIMVYVGFLVCFKLTEAITRARQRTSDLELEWYLETSGRPKTKAAKDEEAEEAWTAQ
jgi:hypothetical protein